MPSDHELGKPFHAPQAIGREVGGFDVERRDSGEGLVV